MIFALVGRGKTYEDMFLGGISALPVSDVFRNFIHSVGTAPQRQLSQRDQRGNIEKTLRHIRCCGLFRGISVLPAFDQLLRFDIHQFHLIRSVKNIIGNAIFYFYAGDSMYDVIQTFDMLYIDCSIDIDAAAQKFFHILIASEMARARSIFMGQFVYDEQLRFSRDRPVQIEFPRIPSSASVPLAAVSPAPSADRRPAGIRGFPHIPPQRRHPGALRRRLLLAWYMSCLYPLHNRKKFSASPVPEFHLKSLFPIFSRRSFLLFFLFHIYFPLFLRFLR